VGSELLIHAQRSLQDDSGMGCSSAISLVPTFRPAPVSTFIVRRNRQAIWPKEPHMTESILVTGSSRGIGRAIALRLTRAGYDIVLHCRSGRTEAQAVQAETQALGQQARVLKFDVADRACKEILEADVETHGAYYGTVCNAGLTRTARRRFAE
jgi:hypothetical protein